MKKISSYIFLFLLSHLPFLTQGQIEGEVIKPRGGKFLLHNATIITVSKDTLENTDLLVADGKIQEIGNKINDADATTLDCSGLFIYPGMIDAGNRLGLVEVNSLAETQDFTEIGNVSPQM